MNDGCPSCGDKQQQNNVGRVEGRRDTDRGIVPVLYRCSACGFLYTVPPLTANDDSAADDE